MQDDALEPIHAFPPRLVRLGVVVIALAHPQEAGRESQLLPGVAPGDIDGPPAVPGGPAGRSDPVLVADVPAEIVLVNDLVEVGEDLLTRRDRRAAPGLEPVAVGEQVAVGAHTRIPVGPPGSASVVLRVQDDEGPFGELVPQVVRGADTRDAGTDNQDVDVTGVLNRLNRRCSRRHGWTSGPRALMPGILTPASPRGIRSSLQPDRSSGVVVITWSDGC